MRSEPNAEGSDSSHLYYYFSGRKDLIAFLRTVSRSGNPRPWPRQAGIWRSRRYAVGARAALIPRVALAPATPIAVRNSSR